MVVGRPMTLPIFKLSGKELLVTNSFKHLGSVFADVGSMSREMDVRNVHWPHFVSFKTYGPAPS
eukprot:354041-Chlamydomonas_euryale.AAC.6